MAVNVMQCNAPALLHSSSVYHFAEIRQYTQNARLFLARQRGDGLFPRVQSIFLDPDPLTSVAAEIPQESPASELTETRPKPVAGSQIDCCEPNGARGETLCHSYCVLANS